MQVERFLEASAERLPDKVALVCGGRRLTYRQIDEASNRLAAALLAAGVRRGDRVAICLENSVEAVLAVFAALKAGGVFMVVNPTTKADKLAFVLNDSRASALFLSGRRMDLLARIAPVTPHTGIALLTGVPEAGTDGAKRLLAVDAVLADASLPATKPANRCIDIDLAALVYTSGSTGTPKGVMLTHLNIVSAATSITTYLENTEDDVIFNVLPLSFDYGLYQVLMAFKVGGTVVVERSFTYPHDALQRLVAERATGFPIVPTIAAILLQLDLSRYDFSSLRYVTNTGAALPTEHIRRLRRLLPHVRLYSMYGLTECKRVSYLPPEEIDTRPTSVGKGMPNEEVYIVDEQGRRLESGVGELVIRGSNVMRGYWERPEETARVLRPGPIPGELVLYSGDIFRMDEEGYLYFIGRKDDIIKTRGEKVSPKEVENVLYELEAVAEAAVVGVPDPILGQAVKAVVTPKPGAVLTAPEVLRHCAARLEDFMVPKIVEVRASLPKTSSGKIDKKSLHAVEVA
ncbi:MAG TPA: AMP-binding protein [Vicinamibacterales bacterium]|nr:AMP-binding protein [Vicinamibacterales bacterium]